MAANNPRKFEEKIAQHKLRQAQETKEFEKIMEEMSFVNAKVHNPRQTRGRYGGSLPDFNLAQSQSARHENASDLSVRHTMEGQSPLKERPYHPRNRLMTTNNRRHNMENSMPYHHFSPYLSPPQIDSNWRRTSSDSSIYHNLTNPNGARKMSTSPDSSREVGSYLAPKDNELDEMNRMSSSGQQQQQQSFNYPSNNGSLPDLSNLHIPSPLSVSIDPEEQQQQQQQYNQNFSGGNSNVFMNRQPRRNTSGTSCKRQVYRHHAPHTLEHLQMPGNYMYQQSPSNPSDPTSPTVAPMYPAPMSPLANGAGYLQYPGLMGSGSLQQQLDQMATIAENMKPANTGGNGQMIQGAPPQSPNTFLNMLSQNPQAMENVRQRFQDVFGQVENNDVDVSNSLASDLGNAIGGFDRGFDSNMRGFQSFGGNTAEFPGGISLEPLDIQDIAVLTGRSGDVAEPEVEEQLRREGNQQQSSNRSSEVSLCPPNDITSS